MKSAELIDLAIPKTLQRSQNRILTNDFCTGTWAHISPGPIEKINLDY
jgi:hypothetical protein